MGLDGFGTVADFVCLVCCLGWFGFVWFVSGVWVSVGFLVSWCWGLLSRGFLWFVVLPWLRFC